MLKRMILGAVVLGAIGIAFQLVVGALFADEPLWSTPLVTVMALTGIAGGYFDTRREGRNRA